MSNDTAILKAFPAAAEYLSSIHLICRDYGFAANHRLADWMGVSTSAVTQALGRLKKQGLVEQERYEHVHLTEPGRLLALKVLKRHFLLEHLLVRTLDFAWDKSDDEAKVLQNQISDDLAEHLDAKLGHPQTCPHGNPMPGAVIEKKLLAATRLNHCQVGDNLLILRITEEGEGIPDMLPFCQTNGVKPGARFQVKHVTTELVTMTKAEGEIHVPARFAAHIGYESA
jgi:DtxR family Mn-dependent transcriptional regulator